MNVLSGGSEVTKYNIQPQNERRHIQGENKKVMSGLQVAVMVDVYEHNGEKFKLLIRTSDDQCHY